MTGSTKSNALNVASEQAADFENAIQATGFGRFNICMLFVSVAVMAAATFEPLSISYILPSAECDLSLSLFDKGLLNAITYCGKLKVKSNDI